MEALTSKQKKEAEIQKIIPLLLKKDVTAIAQFFELFSEEIYNFPIRYYQFDEDEAGDFYLYAFEHLKNGKKLTSFQNKSKFTTWFYSVLRNMVIDFLRSRKNKVATTAFTKTDQDGHVINFLDTIPDQKNLLIVEDEIMDQFYNTLRSMKISHRIIFKLSFSCYLDLTHEEFDWLMEVSGKDERELLDYILILKDAGLEKSGEVKSIEDRLTANFQSITLLEFKINRFFQEHPYIEKKKELWGEGYVSSEVPQEISDMIGLLFRKKKKQANLILQQKKSMLSTRVPYKLIVPLLGRSEGVLSVQLLRIIEKLEQSIKF